MTCIYITHKMDEFFRITDTITVLRDGEAGHHSAHAGLDAGKARELHGRARDEGTLPADARAGAAM